MALLEFYVRTIIDIRTDPYSHSLTDGTGILTEWPIYKWENPTNRGLTIQGPEVKRMRKTMVSLPKKIGI